MVGCCIDSSGFCCCRLRYRLYVNKRLENDKILFSKEQLSKIDLEVDTSNLSIEEIAEYIVKNYKEFLSK